MLDHDLTPLEASSLGTIRLRGGGLCLDLANTMDPRLGDHPHDFLVTYDDLVTWSRRTGIVTGEQEQALRDQAARRPADAQAALARAKDLRETIYRIFSATAAGHPPATADLDALQRVYVEAIGHAQLTGRDGAFRWTWPAPEPGLDDPLWPVAYSAVELLMSPGLARVKECPGLGDCGWLFLDESKNGSRRWCSMEGCGSRAKMRRHYARTRAKRSASGT